VTSSQLRTHIFLTSVYVNFSVHYCCICEVLHDMFLTNVPKNVHFFSNSQNIFLSRILWGVKDLASDCCNTCSVHFNVPGRSVDSYCLFFSLQFLMTRPSCLWFCLLHPRNLRINKPLVWTRCGKQYEKFMLHIYRSVKAADWL
jgi:hypothetical protein